MPDDFGIIIVAFGENACQSAEQLIKTIRSRHSWPILAISDRDIPGAERTSIFDGDPGWGARWAKLNQDSISSWDRWLYLDADTRVLGDLSAGFDILSDGWDLAITLSNYQEESWIWQANDEERRITESDYGRQISFQGGVFFCKRNERTLAFFERWRQEWLRWRRIDQGALIRAFQESPCKVWILGRPYNGGHLIEHLFGRAASA